LLRLVVRGRKGTNGVDGAAGSVLMNGGELGQCMGLLETMGEGSCERRLVQANGLLGGSLALWSWERQSQGPWGTAAYVSKDLKSGRLRLL
jgi:hypothetical protein